MDRSVFVLNERHQSEMHPTSAFQAVRRESQRQRILNSAATHPFDAIGTAIDWEEIGER